MFELMEVALDLVGRAVGIPVGRDGGVTFGLWLRAFNVDAAPEFIFELNKD